MIIHSLKADKELTSIASSINQDPMSWKHWSCIVFEFSEEDSDIKQDCLLWIKSLAEVYFFDIESRIYFTQNEDVHVLCKRSSRKFMDEFSKQINDMANNHKAEHTISSKIYLFKNSAQDYEHVVMTKMGKRSADYADYIAPIAATKKNSLSFNLFQKQPEQACQKKVKLLLVEDDPVTTWMVDNALKDECEIVSVGYASKVYATYGTYHPDIIFLDIGLPDSDGYTVLEWIKRNDPGALVIMFSGQDNLDNVVDALEAGASGFIPKPFLKESLLYYIKNLTANMNQYGRG